MVPFLEQAVPALGRRLVPIIQQSRDPGQPSSGAVQTYSTPRSPEVNSPRGKGLSPAAARAERTASARAGSAHEDHADAQVEGPAHVAPRGPRPRAGCSRKSGGSSQRRASTTARTPSGRTRGRLSGMPPPVMWAMRVDAAPSLEQRRRAGRGSERWTASSASPTVHAELRRRACRPRAPPGRRRAVRARE